MQPYAAIISRMLLRSRYFNLSFNHCYLPCLFFIHCWRHLAGEVINFPLTPVINKCTPFMGVLGDVT